MATIDSKTYPFLSFELELVDSRNEKVTVHGLLLVSFPIRPTKIYTYLLFS